MNMLNPVPRGVRLIAAALCLATVSARAELAWNWSYSGSGITAAGTLVTGEIPDSSGFYPILSIAGSRNGVEITGLYPTGSAIPGNEPFAVDNLIQPGPDGQLTVHGLGYILASGAYSNPFFADFLNPPIYREVFTQGITFSELPIEFHATAVPEAGPATLAMVGVTMMALGRLARRRR